MIVPAESMPTSASKPSKASMSVAGVSAATDKAGVSPVTDKAGVSTTTDKVAVSITSAMRTTLRLEGLLLLVVASVAYFQLGFSGMAFGMLFLVPDVSLLGYLRGPRVGAIVYNAGHSMIGPLALGAVALVAMPALVPYALIWLAHIGFDRSLGYGLKHAAGFQLTHLGRIGRH